MENINRRALRAPASSRGRSDESTQTQRGKENGFRPGKPQHGRVIGFLAEESVQRKHTERTSPIHGTYACRTMSAKTDTREASARSVRAVCVPSRNMTAKRSEDERVQMVAKTRVEQAVVLHGPTNANQLRPISAAVGACKRNRHQVRSSGKRPEPSQCENEHKESEPRPARGTRELPDAGTGLQLAVVDEKQPQIERTQRSPHANNRRCPWEGARG